MLRLSKLSKPDQVNTIKNDYLKFIILISEGVFLQKLPDLEQKPNDRNRSPGNNDHLF